MRIVREALMGPAYFFHKALIKKSKNWSLEEATRYQELRSERLFERFDSYIKDKRHYQENIRKYSTPYFPFITRTVSTGGTTGTPFTFEMDSIFRRQKERAYIFDIWSCVGYSPFDMRVVFRGGSGKKAISYNAIENAWVISPSHVTSESKAEIRNLLARLDPFYLHVYPSSLFTLIELVGVDFFSKLPILGVLAGSESFPINQLQSFEKEYSIPVAHWYGHSEYATLANYCRKCLGFHFYPTYGHTELIPEVDNLCRIVATSFNRIGTKFVRYDTGDLALTDADLCSSRFLRVKSIIGRSQDFFIGRDGAKYAFGPFLFGIHNEFWQKIANIQFVQNSVGEITVFLVVGDSSNRFWVEQFLKNRLSMVSLEFVYVHDIEKTAAGKHRYYINRIEY